MNQYYPRYVDHYLTPPPTFNGGQNMPQNQPKPQPRYWTCADCGWTNHNDPVFLDKWDFTAIRHCPICQAQTKQYIKG